jgi:phosphate transport system substrate-binding protein
MKFICLILLFSFCIACKSLSDKNSLPTIDSVVRISADEAFMPALEAQAFVYKALYPEVQLRIDYKPEADCWKDLYNDSIHMVIVSRSLQPREAADVYDSLEIYPQNHLLAYDAIALIMNRSLNDSVFMQQEVEDMLTGHAKSQFTPVFDGLKATGTVRFALDSILKGKTAALSRFRAARSSREVMDYIEKNPEAIGFVGISWIGNPEDPEQISRLKSVRIAWLPCRGCADSSYTYPSQEEIFYRRYPYTRSIYAVVKEKQAGKANHFIQFMKNDQGQLLFRRMYLVPARRPFVVRETILTTDSL